MNLKCQSCHTGDALDHLGNKIQSHIAYDPSDPAATPRWQPTSDLPKKMGSCTRDSGRPWGMACEACHGSTHAEWPVANPSANDNVAAKQLQGHTGPHYRNALPPCGWTEANDQRTRTQFWHNVNSREWNLNHDIFYELDIANCKALPWAASRRTVLSRAAAKAPALC